MSTSNQGKSRQYILRNNSTKNISNNTAKYHITMAYPKTTGSIFILMKIHIIYIISKVLPQPTNLHKYLYALSVVDSFVVRSMSPKGRKRMGWARLVDFPVIGFIPPFQW